MDSQPQVTVLNAHPLMIWPKDSRFAAVQDVKDAQIVVSRAVLVRGLCVQSKVIILDPCDQAIEMGGFKYCILNSDDFSICCYYKGFNLNFKELEGEPSQWLANNVYWSLTGAWGQTEWSYCRLKDGTLSIRNTKDKGFKVYEFRKDLSRIGKQRVYVPE